MDLKEFFFQHPKGVKTSNLALVGHNLNSRKNLQKQISFIYAQVPRNEPAPPHVDYHPTLIQAQAKISFQKNGRKTTFIKDYIFMKLSYVAPADQDQLIISCPTTEK